MQEIMRLTIPMVGPSLNEWYSQGHWSKRDRHKKAWRAYFNSIKKDIPTIDKSAYPIVVETISYFIDSRRRDCDNWITSNKLACDALVELGILPDDSYHYISQHRASIHPEKHSENFTEIIIYSEDFKLL